MSRRGKFFQYLLLQAWRANDLTDAFERVVGTVVSDGLLPSWTVGHLLAPHSRLIAYYIMALS